MATANITERTEQFGLTHDHFDYVGGTDDVEDLLDTLDIDDNQNANSKDSVVIFSIGNDIQFVYFVFSEIIRQIDLYKTADGKDTDKNTRLYDYITNNTTTVYAPTNETNYYPQAKQSYLYEVRQKGGTQKWWDNWYQNVHDEIFGTTPEDVDVTLRDIGFAGKIIVTNEYQLP